MNYWTQSPQNVYVAAHRGWSEKYPENTMEAFRAAVEAGVDQIETDVRVTKDGHLVLIHDSTVDRTTNCTGKVCDYTLAELQAMDAGSHLAPEFAGCRIPTLIEFMDYVSTIPGMTIDLELKEYPSVVGEELAFSVADQVIEIVEKYNFGDRCVLNSFSGELLKYIYGKHGKKYRIHAFYPWHRMVDGFENPAEYAYCACVVGAVRGEPSKDSFFDDVRAVGVRPWVGCSYDCQEKIDLAIHRGVELITCNNPDVVLECLRNRGCHK